MTAEREEPGWEQRLAVLEEGRKALWQAKAVALRACGRLPAAGDAEYRPWNKSEREIGEEVYGSDRPHTRVPQKRRDIRGIISSSEAAVRAEFEALNAPPPRPLPPLDAIAAGAVRYQQVLAAWAQTRGRLDPSRQEYDEIEAELARRGIAATRKKVRKWFDHKRERI
jgi:hypothetical protein